VPFILHLLLVHSLTYNLLKIIFDLQIKKYYNLKTSKLIQFTNNNIRLTAAATTTAAMLATSLWRWRRKNAALRAIKQRQKERQEQLERFQRDFPELTQEALDIVTLSLAELRYDFTHVIL